MGDRELGVVEGRAVQHRGLGLAHATRAVAVPVPLHVEHPGGLGVAPLHRVVRPAVLVPLLLLRDLRRQVPREGLGHVDLGPEGAEEADQEQ